MIGIGVTTHNRKEIFDLTIKEIKRFLPRNAKLVVVDDASYIPVDSDYRFTSNVGVAVAKNKCLELLDDCEHIFLFDDDTYPIKKYWWKPYVESSEPHLMYQFKLPGKSERDMRVLKMDDQIISYSHTRGCMIYIDRKVLDVVGGMDAAYGLGVGEHTDWTNRIHNAGLTRHRAMDVVGSKALVYCLDQDGKANSSLPERRIGIARNAVIYQKSKKSKEYKEYKSEQMAR